MTLLLFTNISSSYLFSETSNCDTFFFFFLIFAAFEVSRRVLPPSMSYSLDSRTCPPSCQPSASILSLSFSDSTDGFYILDLVLGARSVPPLAFSLFDSYLLKFLTVSSTELNCS